MGRSLEALFPSTRKCHSDCFDCYCSASELQVSKERSIGRKVQTMEGWMGKEGRRRRAMTRKEISKDTWGDRGGGEKREEMGDVGQGRTRRAT